MIKTILTTATILFASIPAALAGPATTLSAVPTMYGQTGCMQRAQNKFYAIGATNLSSTNRSIWGHLNGSTLGVWCRGSEAIVIVSGDNATNLLEEIKSVF